MPIESPERHHPVGPLASRVDRDATAAQIAAVTATLCQEITAVLSPIVGARGVAALHNRSHHLCAAGHTWMAGLRDATVPNTGCETLVALLAQCEPGEALIGGEAYLQTFHALVLSLIGPSLTERLLRTVWPPISSGNPAQDMSR